MRKYLTAGAALLFCTACGSLADKVAIEGRDNQVKENMRLCQEAVEAYAKDHGGKYPAVVDNDLKAYYKDGSGKGKMIGSPPINPFTNVPEWPKPGQIIDLSFERKRMLSHIPPGRIEYTCLKDGYAYAIIGGGADGTAIPRAQGVNRELILTNVREDKQR